MSKAMQIMNVEQQVNDEIKIKMTAKYITFMTSANWYKHVMNALAFASPISLGLSATEMWELMKKAESKKPLNYYEFAILNNNLESRSANDLSLSLAEYATLMITMEEYQKKWEEEGQAIREQAIVDVMEKNKIANSN